MLKEEVVARFKVLSWHTSEETYDRQKIFQRGKMSALHGIEPKAHRL
jgi:hypothetical protein